MPIDMSQPWAATEQLPPWRPRVGIECWAVEGPHPTALVSHREPVLQDSPSKRIHLTHAGHRGWSG